MNKLNKYQKRLDNGESVIDIMNDMEKEFDIPMLNDDQYNEKNSDIIMFYRKVADSRKFN